MDPVNMLVDDDDDRQSAEIDSEKVYFCEKKERVFCS